MLIVSVMALMCASVALALDEEAPRVAGPENIPGADVVLIDGQAYLLDARGSTDNVGITKYTWEITDPTGTTVKLASTTPTRSWTPGGPGLYKVISWAADADGNEGAYVYVVDVVEVISAQLIRDTSVTYDHSIMISSGQLTYTNTDIDFTGGLERDPPSFPMGEMLSEGLTFSGLADGSLAGSWGPYGPAYGAVYEETSRVLVGKASLINTGGINYGFTYTFDNVEDLTVYDSFHAWFQKDFANGRFYWMEFYDASGNNLRVTPPTLNNNVAGTWFGVSMSLDIDNVGAVLNYGLTDLTSVKEFKVRYYGQRYSIIMDGVYFSRNAPMDNMTESATPTGPFAGSWTGWSTGNVAYVGTNSVYRRITANNQIFDMEYKWTNPVKLSNYNALSFYVWYDTAVANGAYARIRVAEFIDADGDVAKWPAISLPYIQSYETDRYGKWSQPSVPFDQSKFTETGTMDWTRVSSMVFEIQAQRVGDLYVDGLEFYMSKRFTPGVPGLTENLAHGIYVQPSATLDLVGVTFEPTGPYGGFIKAEGDLAIRSSTFDNLWGTMHPSIPLEGSTWGGIVGMGADVVLNRVTVNGASSCALTLVNCNVAARNVSVTGVGTDFEGAVGMAIIYSGTASTDVHSYSLSNCEFTETSMGTGLHVLVEDALGSVDGTIDGVTSSDNGGHGIRLSVMGTVGDNDISVTDTTVTENGGTGLWMYCSRVDNSLSYIDYYVDGLDASNNSGSGVSTSMELSMIDLTATFEDVDAMDNSGNGLEFTVMDCSGSLSASLTDVSIDGNRGNGMAMMVGLKPFNFQDETFNPDMDLDIDLLQCQITGNDGNGMYEEWSTGMTITYPPYPKHTYNLDALDVAFSDNRGNGYLVAEVILGAERIAHYSFEDSAFDDNDGCGLLLLEDIYLRATAENYFNFLNTHFGGNERGVEQQITSAFVTVFNFEGCVFAGNDVEAIHGYTLKNTYRYSLVEYYVHECDVDGPMSFNLDGAMMEPAISNRTTLGVTISITDCTLSSEFPLQAVAKARYLYNWAAKYLYIYEAKLFFTGNTMTVPSRSDGLRVEFWGSAVLEAEVVIEDVVFDSPGNDGINLILGSGATLPDHQRIIYGSVRISNVTIDRPGRHGILITTSTIDDMLALRGVLCRLTDVTIRGAVVGMMMDGVDTEVYMCTFSEIAITTVYAKGCTIDLRSSEYGTAYEPNIRAQEAGKVRLWFDLYVKVLWKDSDDPVIGARVELIDNAYKTFGFSEVTGPEDLTFLDLNAITIVESGTFMSNPYRMATTYLDLAQDMYVHITADTTAIVWLVDDIPPILNLRVPEDGSSQSSNSIIVEGTAYDLHRTVDMVRVSIDGDTWVDAEGTETFTCTLLDVPDGTIMVRVRAYDAGGNYEEVLASVLVDTTPPNLVLVSPRDGLVTNEITVKVLAATETGATAYVNQIPVAVEYTLIEEWVDLTEGLNSIEISVSDSLGNVRQVIVTIILDTMAPQLSVVSHEDWVSVSSTSIDLMGMTEPQGVTVQVNDVPVTVSSEGSFETPITLSAGRNDITLEALDTAGNRQVLILTVFLDQEPPALILLEPSDGDRIDGSSVHVVGLVEPGCAVYVGNQEIAVVNGQIDTHLSLLEGAHVIQVKAVDDAGNVRMVEIPIVVDTTPPSLDVIVPSNGFRTPSATVTISGTVSVGEVTEVTVTVNGDTVTIGPDGSFATEVDIIEGSNLIVVMATDGAGNQREIKRTVVRDSMAPFLDFDLPDAKMKVSGIHEVTTDKFMVTGFGELGTTVWVNGVAVDMDPETGFFSIELNIKDGEGPPFTVTLLAMDEAGNTSEDTATVKKVAAEEDSGDVGALGWAVLVIGLLLVLVGIYLLARYRSNPSSDGDEEVMDR